MFFSINNNVYLKTVHINVPIGLVRGPVGPGRSSTHDWPCTVLTKEYVKTIKMCWVFIIPFARMHVYGGGGGVRNYRLDRKLLFPRAVCRICVFWVGRRGPSEENTVPSGDHPVHRNAVYSPSTGDARTRTTSRPHSIVRRTQPVLFLAVSPSTPTPQP